MRWLLLLPLLAACAQRHAPDAPRQRELFHDYERIVTVTAAKGWGVDKLEIEKIEPEAMDSLCRVDSFDRRELARWIGGEIRRLGGPVEKAYQERGKKLDKVDDLLVLTRIQKVLARAEEMSLDCPFWLQPEPDFHGRQLLKGWMVSIGGGGKASLIYQGDQQDLSATGAGRILLGHTLGDSHLLMAGFEFGASAEFPKDEMGQRSSLELAADMVAPLVYRYSLTNAFFEIEGGWLGHSTERAWGHIDNGIHAGIAVGGRALRQRFVFPGAALGISYERTFLDGDDLTTIKIGARFSFDIEL